jgi:hypothetical protein
MLMKKIQHQLELSFWNITIQALSENKLAQQVYRDAYRMHQEPQLFQDWLAVGLTGVAGFISGMGIFFLIAIAK